MPHLLFKQFLSRISGKFALHYRRSRDSCFTWMQNHRIQQQDPHNTRLVLFESALSMQALHEPSSFGLMLSVLFGFPATLWVYKSLVLLIFQRKMIYMGYAPVGARTQTVETGVPSAHLKGIACNEISITSQDGAELAGILVRSKGKVQQTPQTVIIYLQGNAGNPLMCLPMFQTILKPSIFEFPSFVDQLAIVAVAPRSYWKSSPRRPTQSRILADYLSVLHYTLELFPSSSIVIYGHSLGGAAAICLLSQLHEDSADGESKNIKDKRFLNIKGLILENPFCSIPELVRAHYPQRWLPYRYLAPLAFDKWDATTAMRRAIYEQSAATTLSRIAKDMMVILSENDEIVPPQMGSTLHEMVMSANLDGLARKVVVKNASHENAWDKREWYPEMKKYLESIT